MNTRTPLVDVPVFAGQGTVASGSPQVLQQALHDASSSSGFLLLSACHEAFHVEFATLLPDEIKQININLADFTTKNALLAVPQSRYSHNSVISGTRLFLIQALRYLAFAESQPSVDPIASFDNILKTNAELGIGILSLSSGILPACVVATSFSTLAFITRAVQAYRLAFWIGARTQMYRFNILKERGLPDDCALPWSCVFHGISKQRAEEAIAGILSQVRRSIVIVPIAFKQSITGES